MKKCKCLIKDILDPDIDKELAKDEYTLDRLEVDEGLKGKIQYFKHKNCLIRFKMDSSYLTNPGACWKVEVYDLNLHSRIYQWHSYYFQQCRKRFDRLVKYAQHYDDPIEYFHRVFKAIKYFEWSTHL